MFAFQRQFIFVNDTVTFNLNEIDKQHTPQNDGKIMENFKLNNMPPSRRGLQNTPTAPLQTCKIPHSTSGLDKTLKSGKALV